VKKGVTASVRLQPSAQVVPAIDGVNGFVVNDLLQQLGRRIPGDLMQLQKARIEPGAQLVVHVSVNGRPLGMCAQVG